MKRITKTLVFCLTLALLVALAFTVAISASTNEGESTPVKILAQNAAYSDKVAIVYAVDVTLEEAENVTLSYYLKGAPDVIYTASLRDITNTDNVYTDAEGVSHPSLSTIGFAGYDFCDVVYATAYIGDTIPADAEWMEYSVAEYLYARLYKDGFINKTEADGDDYIRKTHYENTLAYGASSQELLVNMGAAEADKETLITDYCYIYFDKGYATVNGKTSGLYLPNEEITVSYAGPDTIYGWNVYSNGESKTLAGAADITVAAVKDMSFDAIKYNLSTFESAADVLTPTDYVTNVQDSTNLMTYAIVDDPTGAANKVLHVQKAESEDATSEDVFYSYMTPEIVDSESTTFIFEADVYMSSASSTSAYLVNIGFDNADPSTGNSVSEFTLYRDADGVNIIERCASSSGNNKVVTVAKNDSWFKLRIEINAASISQDTAARGTSNVYVKIYINNNLLTTLEGQQYNNASYGDKEAFGNIETLRFVYRYSESVDVYFDNMIFAQGVK